MDLEKELQNAEKKQKQRCPNCSSILLKHKKGENKNNILSLGVRACHNCDSTWLIHNIRQPTVQKVEWSFEI